MTDYRIGLDIGNKEDMDCVTLQNVETNEINAYYSLKNIEEHDKKIRAEERKKVCDEIRLKALHSNFGYMGRTEKGYYSLYAGYIDDIEKGGQN